MRLGTVTLFNMVNSEQVILLTGPIDVAHEVSSAELPITLTRHTSNPSIPIFHPSSVMTGGYITQSLQPRDVLSFVINRPSVVRRCAWPRPVSRGGIWA